MNPADVASLLEIVATVGRMRGELDAVTAERNRLLTEITAARATIASLRLKLEQGLS